MRHHAGMSRSPDAQQAQSYLDRLAGLPVTDSGLGPRLELQLDFGAPGSPRLTISSTITITRPGEAPCPDDVVSHLEQGTLPGISRAVDVTVADDGELTLRFADGELLTAPPDENYEAWELRDDTGLLVVCMPGGSLAIFAPDQPDAAQAFTLEGPDGVKWIIGPLFDPYRVHGHAPSRARQREGYRPRSSVEVQASGLVAHTASTLAGDGPRNLAEFFADLAASWRGWDGEHRWRALEGEMEIEASHDRRARVLIAVTIKRPQVAIAKDFWSARVAFTLEAGEQLRSVALDLASVLVA